MLLQGFTAGADGWGWHWQGDIILEHRLPRSLSAVAVGILLASAGVLLQTLTRNPMASPEVLGISSGVALAVLAAFIAFPALGSGGLLLAGALLCLKPLRLLALGETVAGSLGLAVRRSRSVLLVSVRKFDRGRNAFSARLCHRQIPN